MPKVNLPKGPQTGKCRCGRPIERRSSKDGWYHKAGTTPPIGHYAQPSVVA